MGVFAKCPSVRFRIQILVCLCISLSSVIEYPVNNVSVLVHEREGGQRMEAGLEADPSLWLAAAERGCHREGWISGGGGGASLALYLSAADQSTTERD